MFHSKQEISVFGEVKERKKERRKEGKTDRETERKKHFSGLSHMLSTCLTLSWRVGKAVGNYGEFACESGDK